jgi:hypothetical protein
MFTVLDLENKVKIDQSYINRYKSADLVRDIRLNVKECMYISTLVDCYLIIE